MNAQLDNASLAKAIRERDARRTADPLMLAFLALTAVQRGWVESPALEKLAEGGNQSGKTWAAVIDFLLDALGMHPAYSWPGDVAEIWIKSYEQGVGTFQSAGLVRIHMDEEDKHGAIYQEISVRGLAPAAGQNWRGWYSTVTYDLFAQQGWAHFKRLLLFPGESVHQLPTRRILDIGWDKKNPERPMYMKLRRGVGVPLKKINEPIDGARLTHSCTPVLGVPYITTLREDAESGGRKVCHARFDTRDNPAADPAQIAEIVKKFRHRPELIDLRLGGYPLAMEGLVYNDLIFNASEHFCDPFPIPGHWARYRVIDPSWRNCAFTWWAVSPGQEDYILYRDYIGHERTVAENCAHAVALGQHERYVQTWIDRNYCQKHEEANGEKVIEIYRKNGVACVESVPIGITAGIFDTWELLAMRSGPNGARPRFRVFRTCTHFTEERRKYRWPEAREKGNEGVENPVDRDNHVLKCFVYFWAARPTWRAAPARKPLPGSTEEMLVKDRNAGLKMGRRI